MELIIQQIGRKALEETLEKMMHIVSETGLRVDTFVPKTMELISRMTVQVYEQLVNATDEAIYDDKEGRRKEGWVLERRGDSRTIMTRIGEIRYHRNYYLNRKTHKYKYLTDEIVGVAPYVRVDNDLSKQLVQRSRHVSYQRAAEESCEGQVSKQTVMNKIRKAKPVIEVPEKKRRVPELHIDADEDHVAMQDKKYRNGTVVPLVSVYEGIEQLGTRKCCKNIFHISAYKQDADAFWENVLNRIEQRYDLTDTRIYLHGDGAAWIARGMEWLPDPTFVLDMYHKNKYIKHMLAGYDTGKATQLRKDIDQALMDMDEDYFDNIVALLIECSPEREDKIRKAAAYLREHMEDIAIRATDPDACNGGATEPHVSHVLSERLSSRPKGWSEKTLQFFAPILANGPNVMIEGVEPHAIHDVAEKALAKTQRQLSNKGNVSPWQGSLPTTTFGKRTTLYEALQGLVSTRLR